MLKIVEKILVLQAKQGNAFAFEKLIKTHQKKLYKFALGILEGDEVLAQDVLQNAFLKAFLNISKFEHKSSFSSWIWVIVKNEFYDYLKKNRFFKTFSIDDFENVLIDNEKSPHLEILKEEKKRNLHNLVNSLDDKYREVITLVIFMEMSYKEASDYLNIPVGSVKSRLKRAKEKLEKKIKLNVELFL